MPTYRDYSWLQPYRDGSLALGYCVAAIPGGTPAQVLDTLGAAHVTEAIGLAELSGVALDLAAGASNSALHQHAPAVCR
ncbi:DUF6461 domain-containing protein [Rhodococcus qingshengii]|uniref:DUF6461 domain-containing protein n=1 Tax=Rhodococcus qingshengii TaxID=334542 RepID=UPI0021B0FFE9|nr:DUF6461 domain-containing protein [Rhodococcus qingshengii]MCT6735577.1 DUF6461 domain-containing protein [Rhodococcus qingshengii]